MIERLAGRYSPLRPLGSGGMGDVFLALDRATGTECALKRLRPEALAGDPEALRREFAVLAGMRHPLVVQVFDFGVTRDGTPFYTMEYVPGVPAGDAVAPGDWDGVAWLAAQVIHGLEALHARGMFHGDLKPSNVLVVPGPLPGPPREARLVDFGLAGLLAAGGRGHRGSPGYAAPEVVHGEPPSARSDLFGLGATLYALGTGQRVPRPDIVASGLAEAGSPPDLTRLLLRLLTPTATERLATAREARIELERIAPSARRELRARLDLEVVVGRERELAQLDRWLTQAQAPPRVLLLVGEMGVGKSALLEAAAVRAELAGHRVCRLRAGAIGTGGGPAAWLERLELEAGTGAAGAPVERRAAAAATAPRVLVLVDDAERLDEASRVALRGLALRPDLGGLRWVWSLSRRPGDLAEDERLLVESGEARLVLLPPLERDGAERLVASRLQEQPPADLCRELWQRAGGHPGLLIELLRVAAERGALQEREGDLLLDAAKLAGMDLPDSLEAAALARLAVLPAAGCAAVRALAILDRPARDGEIAAVAGAAGAGALAELERSGLGRCDRDGTWSLSPPGLAAAIARVIPEAERAALHTRALGLPGLGPRERFAHLREAGRGPEALADAEASLADSPDEALALQATELAERITPEAAPQWQQRTARILMDRGRHPAAVPLIERALQSPSRLADRPRLWHLHATALLRTGSPEQVREAILRARQEDLPAVMDGMLGCSEAAALFAQGDLPGAAEVAERALQIGRESGDAELLGAAALSRGGVELARGNMDAAVALGREAEFACARGGLHLGRLRAMGLQAAALAPADLVRAEGIFAAALDEARAKGWRMVADELLGNWAQVLVKRGRWPAARELHAEAYRIALEDGRPGACAIAAACLVHDDGLLGDPQRGLRLARAAARLVRWAQPTVAPFLWRTIGRIHRVSGRDRLARRALARVRRGTRPGEKHWCALEEALLLARSGRWEAAGRRCLETLDHLGGTDPLLRVLLLVLAGRAEVRRGDTVRAQERLQECERWTKDCLCPYFTAHMKLLAAEREVGLGRVAEGTALMKQVLEEFSGLPAPAERAAAILDFVGLVPEPESLPQSLVAGWLADAVETCARLGDERLRARVLALEVGRLRRMERLAGRPTGDLLRSVSRLVGSLTDLGDLTHEAMALAVEQLGAERGVLLLMNSGVLLPAVEHGALDAAAREHALGYSRRVVERVTREGGSLLVTDAPSDPEMLSESVIDLGLRSILCVPLYGAGEVIGAVYLDDSRRAEAFGEDERRLLEGFAELVAQAVEKSRGHEAIRRENELLVGENLALRRRAGLRFQRENFIAMSAAMQEVLAMVERAAQVSSTVLVTGENGTGKELVARILHHSGKRGQHRFVSVNCGAIPATLLETELFGILPNVATGVRARDGKFVEANGGTLFLDEVGEMPLQQQVALLSVLANHEVTPVGGGRSFKVDVRVIAASNRDLRRRVEEGAFREDLYYRLNVIPIEIPPLRKRKADIPALAHYFAANFAGQQERDVPEFSPEFLAALMQSDWPGNVRELQNYVERILAMTPGRVLHPRPLPHDLHVRLPRLAGEAGRPLLELVEELEKKQIQKALTRTRGNQTRAAIELGLTEHALRYRIRKYGLPDFRRFRQLRRKPRRSG